MFATACVITSLMCLILGRFAKAVGCGALGRLFAYGGSLGLGFAVADRGGAAVGLVLPVAATPVTGTLCVLWALIEWHHAPIRRTSPLRLLRSARRLKR